MKRRNAGASSSTFDRGKQIALKRKRVNVLVPAEDAAAMRELAAALRANGGRARQVRRGLYLLLRKRPARTGESLVDFLRRTRLSEIPIEREIDRGRDVMRR